MNTSLTLSTIIPTRGNALELRECLNGMKRSRLVPMEVIVVNDGSTGNTASVAADFEDTTLSCLVWYFSVDISSLPYRIPEPESPIHYLLFKASGIPFGRS